MCEVGLLLVLVVPLIVAASAQGTPLEASLYGWPEITRFKGGRPAAFSVQFEDSMDCHAVFCIPEMNQRGLAGTFFINPGLGRHLRHREVWEEVCPKFGHELANHTMHHKGARDFREADHEVGDCSRYIWGLYPNGSKLRPHLRGGTRWNVSRETRHALADKYFLFPGLGGPGRAGCSEESGTGRAVIVAQEALEDGKWGHVSFHGVGEGPIVTSAEHFVELLDYLAANRDKIWVGTTGEVYRYCQERYAVKSATLSDASGTGFKLSIECDATKVKTYRRPFVELYDEPLTVRVEVPDSWLRFTVVQGDESKDYEATDVNGSRYALFDVRPNRKPATVSRRGGSS